jgi:septum site-determining protein MinC
MSSSSVRPVIDIKSADLPLVALLLKSHDLARVAADLRLRLGDQPDFFDHDPLVIDLSPLQEQGECQVDFASLRLLLQRYRLVPVAVKGGSAAQMQSAVAAGLAAAPEARTVLPAEPPAAEQAPAVRTDPAFVNSMPPQLPAGPLVVDRPLRSGQQVYARGRDLVVLAMVNPGAEVLSDGHIHVYAPLRGKAIAGARGNIDARIYTLSLEAELLSIAGVYRTSDTPLPADVAGKPAQVRLEGDAENGKLVMAPLRA